MTILIALDSFKDYKSSIQICGTLAEGLHILDPSIKVVLAPLADGGEGSLDVLSYYKHQPLDKHLVSDPLGRPVSAKVLYDEAQSAGYVSMAEASGIELLSAQDRNCYYTSTYGTGELIAHLVKKGMQALHLFVGGSATCDAGLGMLSALGAEVISDGHTVTFVRGVDLLGLDKIVFPSNWQRLSTTIYADVDNRLYGRQGAAHIYGPQKGATAEQIEDLDKGLLRFAQLAMQEHGIDVNQAGSGAAGGIVAGAMLGFEAETTSGADYFCQLADLPTKINAADAVITGEGHLDHQTASGKLVSKVCHLAEDKQVIAVCGKSSISQSDQQALGIDHVVSLLELDSHPQPGKMSDTLQLVPAAILAALQ